MPRLTLEQVKAQQREAIRLRTERRVAELRVEQGKRDWEDLDLVCISVVEYYSLLLCKTVFPITTETNSKLD